MRILQEMEKRIYSDLGKKNDFERIEGEVLRMKNRNKAWKGRK